MVDEDALQELVGAQIVRPRRKIGQHRRLARVAVGRGLRAAAQRPRPAVRRGRKSASSSTGPPAASAGRGKRQVVLGRELAFTAASRSFAASERRAQPVGPGHRHAAAFSSADERRSSGPRCAPARGRRPAHRARGPCRRAGAACPRGSSARSRGPATGEPQGRAVSSAGVDGRVPGPGSGFSAGSTSGQRSTRARVSRAKATWRTGAPVEPVGRPSNTASTKPARRAPSGRRSRSGRASARPAWRARRAKRPRIARRRRAPPPGRNRSTASRRRRRRACAGPRAVARR